MKKLAKWLERDYEIVDNVVKRKGVLSAKIFPDTRKEKIHTFPEDAYWILANTTADNPTLITSCSTVLYHAYCLHLAHLYKVKINDERYIKKMPTLTNNWHGVVWIFTKKRTFGDGECMGDVLDENGKILIRGNLGAMKSYPMTMCTKRGEDRAILRELGLYHQGFLSEVENPEEIWNKDNRTKENPKKDYIKAVKAFRDEYKEHWQVDPQRANKELQNLVATFLNIKPEECRTDNFSIEQFRTASMLLEEHILEQREFIIQTEER